MLILHLLQNSLPKISGSTIRTKYIFKYQKKFVKLIALTSFVFNSFQEDLEIIEGIPHFRVRRNVSSKFRLYLKYLGKLNYIFYKYFNIDINFGYQDFIISFYMRNYISKLVKYYKVDIIHAHSYYLAGKYGLPIAKKRNIPFIYEVRGFIEENLIANSSKRNRNSKLIAITYKNIKRNETELMTKSDLIITLSKSMKDEIVQRNIDKDKIKIIPNGTDTDVLIPTPPNQNLIKKLDLKDQFVIGFIGRITWYEGIEILFKSINLIKKEVKNIKVILIGNIDKEYFNYLEKLARELKITHYISYIGSVPHESVIDYYSIIDIIVLPRVNFKVCRVVTPLKPLEAMALNTLVIASDFPSFRSIIIPKKTGVLFQAENPKDLASKIVYYNKNSKEKSEIEIFARNYAEDHFSWKKIIPKYKELYLELIKAKNS